MTRAESTAINGREVRLNPFEDSTDGSDAIARDPNNPAVIEAQKSATAKRKMRWAGQRYDVAALATISDPWAQKLATAIERRDAGRDPVAVVPMLVFKGDDAVKAGASDDQIAALSPLTPEATAALNLRAAAIRQADRRKVDEMARQLAVGGDDDDDEALYLDIAALLTEGLPEAPKPDILLRADGVGLFYRGEINLLYGDPEDGKTMIALAACAETLTNGGVALFIDLDDNGAPSIIARLIMLGAPEEALRAGRFRYCAPADRDRLEKVIADSSADGRVPDITVIDCVGELIPLFGGNNDSADDFTKITRATAAPLARAGSAVVLIDHMAKNSESRKYGAGGTMAKRRRVGGTQLRVSVDVPLRKGQGGSLRLLIRKDRHSGLRAHCHPAPDAEGLQLAGTFIIDPGDTAWCVAVDPLTADTTSVRPMAPGRAKYVEAARSLGDGWTIRQLADRVHGDGCTEAERKTVQRTVDEMVNDTPPLAEVLGGRGPRNAKTYRVIR